mmetsp:Transcript_5921/g.13781  ORF Transcript_5921/g.13781 Transcript_5921/m.13781 type:complete len:89 (-) Transcript_5921:258-524(-)
MSWFHHKTLSVAVPPLRIFDNPSDTLDITAKAMFEDGKMPNLAANLLRLRNLQQLIVQPSVGRIPAPPSFRNTVTHHLVPTIMVPNVT